MSVSVIIPVKNGALTLERCLKNIRNQSIPDIEIIVLDSMSTDDSREIALRYNAKIIEIPDGTFNHGLTRNLGVQCASGNYLFFTVQDAFLAGNDMLDKMLSHFKDKNIMGVVGSQAVPHEKDKNPLIWYKRFSEPIAIIREIKDKEYFLKADHAHQRSLIAWDNVIAMYRKSALLEQPFVATEFAEDWIWSRDALLKGWSLVYDSSVVTYHYHHQSYKYAYQVAYTLNYHFQKHFSFKPGIPDLIVPMLNATYHLGKHPYLTLKEKLFWILHNYNCSIAVFNSHVNYLLHLYIGGAKSIEKRYRKVCKLIPQGAQLKKQEVNPYTTIKKDNKTNKLKIK